MIKLADILKEIEEPKFDFSDLNNLDDGIKAAIEAAPKPEKEIIATSAIILWTLAAPGIINTITRIITTLLKKNGFNLSKNKNNGLSAIKFIEQLTAKIDDYLDTPFRLMLTPLIKDPIKRDKTAKVLKAITLALTAIFTSVDVSQIQPTMKAIKDLAPNIYPDIATAIADKHASLIGEILKNFFKNTVQAVSNV
jgi:hypothetical protein